MRKSRSLAKRNTALAKPNISLSAITIIALVGFVIYLIWKNRSNAIIHTCAGNYHNEEVWDVEVNSDGIPTRIVVHRDAKRS